MGVRKVNIDTDCRMAMTGQFRKIAGAHPNEFDPRKFLVPAMAGMEKLYRNRIGSAGHAALIKVIDIDDMAARYAAGKLDPITTAARAA
jgi:fructose-bisphosphate aldolase, class II